MGEGAGPVITAATPSDREGVVALLRSCQLPTEDLPTALERSAAWLRRAQQWLGEPLDVIAVHLDYDDRAGSPYYEVKLLCNEEDLAGAPLAVRRVERSETH